MSKYVVVVADAQRARVFALKESLTPEIESTPRLVETGDLVNTAHTAAKAERRGTPSSGRNKSGSGGSYAFDDHREKRDLDGLRRFCNEVVKAALKETKAQDAHSLVLVAGRKALGPLREVLAGIKTNGLGIKEWDKDLTGDPAARIHELLAKQALIPASKKPAPHVHRTGAGLRKPRARAMTE